MDWWRKRKERERKRECGWLKACVCRVCVESLQSTPLAFPSSSEGEKPTSSPRPLPCGGLGKIPWIKLNWINKEFNVPSLSVALFVSVVFFLFFILVQQSWGSMRWGLKVLLFLLKKNKDEKKKKEKRLYSLQSWVALCLALQRERAGKFKDQNVLISVSLCQLSLSIQYIPHSGSLLSRRHLSTRGRS